MSNPESTRPGWILRGIGAFFMLLAVVLVALDIVYGDAIWPVNIVTFGVGAFNFYLGTKRIRYAREHHQYMERNRAEIARLKGELS